MNSKIIYILLLFVSQGLQAQVSNTISEQQFKASIGTFNYNYLLYLLKNKTQPYATDFEKLGNKQVSIEQIENFF